MVTPPTLQKGDTLGIVSTARKIQIDELRPFLQLIESWGLHYELGSSIGAECDQFAGDDSLRASDLQRMLDDRNIKAIWCARGGYGTVRIIDQLNFTKFIEHPKWIIGYSDVTVLHSHIHKLRIETLHANIALGIESKTEDTRRSIRNVLFGEKHAIAYAIEGRPSRKGKCKGELVGGNLSILYSLCGSPSSINTDGKILFIEDLDEYLYHIDRMLQNLRRNGMLKSLAGLIVGGMSDMNDNTIPYGKTAEEIVLEAVSEYDFPVCFHCPAGHITDNRALIFGRKVKLEILEKEVQLTF